MAYDRRTIDIRTRLIHAADLEKTGHYNYDLYTACGRNTAAGRRSLEYFDKPKETPVTCIECLAVDDPEV